eukprot:gnl/TRDRNA2_/TRDRNA2_80262_c0_seq1.p1 gnl/TRDRNA2_/TRDRNA2_80262_c0~~gnl/TRDRNA2_/TRDRNA2_80262_c0_seq1.p1  ORF type:complete len:415 (-),score=69.33 gnl/TRDRNA2_/TRDRNA2_80262_c0_seq1:74-1258(-)
MGVAPGSAKLLAEVHERTTEFDLTLAGISDNTARHGKAISELAEQQKRTASNLESVARAVKRLARGTMGAVRPLPAGMAVTAGVAEVPLRSPLHGGVPEGIVSEGGTDAADLPGEQIRGADGEGGQGDRPIDWWDEGGAVDATRRAPGVMPAVDPDALWEDEYGVSDGYGYGYNGWGVLPPEDNMWDWPGVWPSDFDNHGFALGPHDGDSDQPRRCWSGSSCGSSRRPGKSGGQHRPQTARNAGGADTFPDQPRASNSRTPLREDPAPAKSSEMAHCVAGVLAKIEEALTKLDTPSPNENVDGRPRASNDDQRPVHVRAPHSWGGVATPGNSGGGNWHGARPSPGQSRRTSTPRGRPMSAGPTARTQATRPGTASRGHQRPARVSAGGVPLTAR